MQTIINRIRNECGLEVLTAEERVMIVKAMNFAQGHWYKCPNGHIYAIGECGGTMEERKCPDCDATIGATHHRLLEGNQVSNSSLEVPVFLITDDYLKEKFGGY